MDAILRITPPPVELHVPDRRVHTVVIASDVHADQIEILRAGRFQSSDMRHSNAVHQDMDAAVAYDSLHHFGDRGVIGCIADRGSGFPARRGYAIHRIPGLPRIDIEDMNAGTSSRKCRGNGLADSTAGPGDQGTLVAQPEELARIRHQNDTLRPADHSGLKDTRDAPLRSVIATGSAEAPCRLRGWQSSQKQRRRGWPELRAGSKRETSLPGNEIVVVGHLGFRARFAAGDAQNKLQKGFSGIFNAGIPSDDGTSIKVYNVGHPIA